MSANVYVAFDSFGDGGNLYMIYDDGYISSDYRGFVYLKDKEYNIILCRVQRGIPLGGL
jgi:hypothetical protein